MVRVVVVWVEILGHSRIMARRYADDRHGVDSEPREAIFASEEVGLPMAPWRPKADLRTRSYTIVANDIRTER